MVRRRRDCRDRSPPQTDSRHSASASATAQPLLRLQAGSSLGPEEDYPPNQLSEFVKINDNNQWRASSQQKSVPKAAYFLRLVQ